MMPSRYNADISLQDAREMAGILRVRYDEIPIEGRSARSSRRWSPSSATGPRTPPSRTSRRASAGRC